MNTQATSPAGFPQRALHIDFHTMPHVHDIGRDFDAVKFIRALKEAGIEYVTVFATCNLGFAYFPTKIGVPQPSLQRDLLGEMVAACKSAGIKVAAYFNAGLNHEQALRHREWARVDRNGTVYDIPNMGHYFRTLCLNSGYGAHLLAMVKEVLDHYPVDGVFLDCFTMKPCYGYECLTGMQSLGLDPLNEFHAEEYSWRITDDFRARVNQLVSSYDRNLHLYLNGLPFRWQSSHLELEVLPTGGWGYDVLPWHIRYARTLDKPFFTMTARFHGSWGDFGGLRTRDGLLFDLYNSIANGGTCSIGDHMHPRGTLESEVYGLISSVYDDVAQLEPWRSDRKAPADIAIVEPRLRRIPGDLRLDIGGVAGAARMLSELKYQFDVSDGDGDLSEYRVIILPDRVIVDDPLQAKLEAHLARGGVIISSGDAGLAPDKSGFALSAYELDYEGAEPFDPTFILVGEEISAHVPAMPLTVYSPGAAIRPRGRTRVLARLMKSYFNRQTWDGFHENMYMPPDVELDRPAIVQGDGFIHFSFPVFSGYYENAVIAYKQILANCLTRLFADPLIKVEGLPSFGQVTLTQNETSTQVHLLAYVPELRGKQMQVIEEPITVCDVKVSLRSDAGSFSRVYLAPSRIPLDWSVEGNHISTTVPRVSGYQMVVFEQDDQAVA